MLGILLVSGCASMEQTYVLNVDSVRGPNEVGKNVYVLLPGNKGTKPDDAQFREYAQYVNRALEKQGFVPAESPEKANVAIYLAYGVGDPKEHQYSYSIPEWQIAGGGVVPGTVSSYGDYVPFSEEKDFVPTTKRGAHADNVGTYRTYFKFIMLHAVDVEQYNKTKKEVQLWNTTITSASRSGKLQKEFPVLVAGAEKYIATNTGKTVKVEIRAGDPRVREIRGEKKTTVPARVYPNAYLSMNY